MKKNNLLDFFKDDKGTLSMMRLLCFLSLTLGFLFFFLCLFFDKKDFIEAAEQIGLLMIISVASKTGQKAFENKNILNKNKEE